MRRRYHARERTAIGDYWAGPAASYFGEPRSQEIVVDEPDDPRAWMADRVNPNKDRAATSCSRAEVGRDSPVNTAGADSAHPPLATTADATVEKKEEADTEAPEDVRDLNALLLPSGTFPLDVERFSVSYSTALFAGWVKQGSPCCAAASVAGAWNALKGRPRGVKGALNSELVLGAMRAVLEDNIAATTARFERLLGGSVAPLILAIETELSREGKHLGGCGRRSALAKGPYLLRMTRSIISRECDREDHSDTFDLLWELYDNQKTETDAPVATKEGLVPVLAAERRGSAKQEAWTSSVTSDGAKDVIGWPEDDVAAATDGDSGEGVDTNTEDGRGVDRENGAAPAVEPLAAENTPPPRLSNGRPKGIDPAAECRPKGARRHRASSRKVKRCSGGEEEGGGAGWNWKKDLCALLKLMGGLNKLCAKSPSTAAFGNAGLISTVRYLDGALPDDDEVTARLFMGKGEARSARVQVPLSARDGEEEKAKQWAALREAFLTDQQVLLFHLTNHYALIFALREWRSSTGPPTMNAAAATATTAAATTATVAATASAATTTAAAATTAVATVPLGNADHSCESGHLATPAADVAGHDQSAVGGDGEPVAGNRGVRQDRRGVPGGGWTRQMLTARRGQRPTAWVDFEEARKIMLSWAGYKIMTVRRGGAVAPDVATVGRR